MTDKTVQNTKVTHNVHACISCYHKRYILSPQFLSGSRSRDVSWTHTRVAGTSRPAVRGSDSFSLSLSWKHRKWRHSQLCNSLNLSILSIMYNHVQLNYVQSYNCHTIVSQLSVHQLHWHHNHPDLSCCSLIFKWLQHAMPVMMTANPTWIGIAID